MTVPLALLPNIDRTMMKQSGKLTVPIVPEVPGCAGTATRSRKYTTETGRKILRGTKPTERQVQAITVQRAFVLKMPVIAVRQVCLVGTSLDAQSAVGMTTKPELTRTRPIRIGTVDTTAMPGSKSGQRLLIEVRGTEEGPELTRSEKHRIRGSSHHIMPSLEPTFGASLERTMGSAMSRNPRGRVRVRVAARSHARWLRMSGAFLTQRNRGGDGCGCPLCLREPGMYSGSKNAIGAWCA